MATKNELLTELIKKDPTGLVEGLNNLLVENSLKSEPNRETLLYRRGREPRAAIRVREIEGNVRSEFSFPKNYWNLQQESLRIMLQDVPERFQIPIGGRYGQQSAGRIEINSKTEPLIRSFIQTLVSENGKYIPPSAGSDRDSQPNRECILVNRILRDTEVTKRIKSAHDHHCQICGLTLELPGGKKYAEGHHIRPLGEPHNGPDIEENVICVCPNHHVLLDYGAMELSPDIIRNMELSFIAPEYLEYHNAIVCKENKT